ncbi:tRNA pseudouridine synthase A [Kocuria tytonicola]|uniref:tRNA pseudouridine synthase A n=1 Tax=Kocuria tytonicola TaxID=2055946 RepID=A0A3L9LDP7_9MICC|nr:tRNA pseudouridine synthase A [Kocuria tytonicola]RLY94432.1 tRNA pseudouridine synthase A [Kocuria tytonicola]
MQDELTRLRIDLAYDGAPFRGWARQPGLPSVQSAVEDALELVVRRPCTTVVAGRTDTGVHARRQTLHVDVPSEVVRRAGASGGEPTAPDEDGTRGRRAASGGCAPDATVRASDGDAASRVPSPPGPDGGGEDAAWSGEPVPGLTRRLNGALNRVLGKDRTADGWEPAVGAVVVHDVVVAPAGFDARFSALSRGYLYRIADTVTGHDPLTRGFAWWLGRELDVPAMDAAVRELLGLHDFLSFCKPREGATTVRELQRAGVRRDGTGMITVRLTADAFCHHMVRSVVGAVVRVGEGRRAAAWPGERLRARTRDASVVMAPAHGLVLDAVDYPEASRLEERAVLTRARREEA